MKCLLTIASLLIFLATAAVADLPPVTPPKGEVPPEPDAARLVYQMTIFNAGRAGPNTDARVASGPPEGDRLALDLLMKRTADVRTEMPANLRNQLNSLDAFGKLSVDEMHVVVPELLELLRNRAAIRGSRGLQIRHRANLALANIARVYMGQFPPADADPADQKPAANPDDLIAQWTAWWAEASSLDSIGQAALSKKLRQGRYDRTDITAFLTNVTFAAGQGDPTPTMLVAQWLDEATPETQDSPEGQKLLQLLADLSSLPDAPAEGLLALYNMVADIGPIELGSRSPNQRLQSRMQTVGNLLQKALKVGADWREHRQVDQEMQARGIYMIMEIRAEALQAWENAILQKMEQQTAKGSSSQPPVMPDADVPDLEHDTPLSK